MLIRLLLISIIFLQSLTAFAVDVKDFTFSHLGIQEGILNQRVYALHQTSDGAVWWATRLGIDRTNGVSISNYPIDDSDYGNIGGRAFGFASYDSKALRDSVFIFNNQGKVYRYDKVQNRFECRYDITKYMGLDIVVEKVMISDKGMLFAMREGLYWVDNKNRQKPVAIDRSSYYNAIFTIKDGKEILVARNKELARLVNGKSLQPLLKENTCSVYYDKATDILWIGTLESGVKMYHMSTGQWKDVAGVPHNPVRSITPYNTYTMLFGIDGFGVYQCEIINSRMMMQSEPSASVLFNANAGQNGVISGNGVYDILVDEVGNIVVCSYSGGIDIARPTGNAAQVFRHSPNNLQCLGNDHVNCCLQQDATHLLMGTDNGLSIYNTQDGSWNNIANGIVVLDLCKKPDGGLLMATYGNGVCEIGGDGKAHSIYNKANGTLKDDHVYRLLYDRKGNLWIGSLFGSLAVKTPTGFRYYNIDNVLTLNELYDGRIAIGSAHGLFSASLSDTKVREMKYSTNDKEVANTFILSLYEDDRRNLWIATDGGGVYIFNQKSGKCQQLTVNDGLPSNHISSITCDYNGWIWLATSRGLAFVSNSRQTKVTDVNYCNGLRTEYSRDAAFVLSDGRILLGTIDGARIISPDHLIHLNYKAELHLLRVVDAGVNEKDIEKFNLRVADMLADGKLNLSYGQRTFELHFESINMRYNYDIAYQYRMGDGEWSKLSNESFIRFVNLESGHHTLYIRCVSKAGGIVLDEVKLKITIGQPWWNSWWMWCIYIMLLALAFYGAWRIYDLQARYSRLIMERVNETSYENDNDNENQNENVNDNHDDNDDDDKKEESTEFVDKATEIVLDNLSDSSFTIDTLCREIGMSRTLFYVKVKSFTGKSPQDFVRMIRLEKAASMLRRGHSVSAVAAVTGFDNPKYFSVVFKKYFGTTPSKYKE